MGTGIPVYDIPLRIEENDGRVLNLGDHLVIALFAEGLFRVQDPQLLSGFLLQVLHVFFSRPVARHFLNSRSLHRRRRARP